MGGILGTGGSFLAGNGGSLTSGTGGAFGAGGNKPFGAGGSPLAGNGGALVNVAGGAQLGMGGGIGNGGSAGGGSGAAGMGGASGSAGSGGSSGASMGGGAGMVTGGMCCTSGDCLCHGPNPTGLTHANGPYKTATLTMPTGTVHYPTDAEPPLAGIAICPGFLNTGPEMAPWGPFYASWGIVCVVTNTGAADAPNIRGDKLVAAIQDLKKQNMTGPLSGKLAGRYGTSGYSMGGGGTTFASEADPTMKTSVGLAAWGPAGGKVKTPTLFICSDADTVASCTGTNSSYAAIPSGVPKMILDIPGVSHFNWFSPTDAVAGNGESGEYALAFNKVYLEGDERWKPILKTMAHAGTIKMDGVN
jgi:hypothetical protein